MGTYGGYTDAAVAKLSGAGQLRWLKDWSATYDFESHTAIVSDGQGGAVAAGTVAFTLDGFPPQRFETHQITRFDAAGNVAWLHPNHGLTLFSTVRHVLVDGSGQVWAAIHIDPHAFSTPSVWLERIGSGGQTLWRFTDDGPTHAGAWLTGLQLDEAGRVLAGVTSGDPFAGADNQSILMRMAASGTHAWTEVFAAPAAGLSTTAILPAPDRRVVMVGSAVLASPLRRDGLVVQVELDDPLQDLGN